MEEDPAGLEPGTVLAGRFRVVRCMGVGGMGSVYEIEHELTKHRRALKLLHAAMAQNSHVVERFLREASAAGRVGNQHIVETFDAGKLDSGEPYLIMEMLRGQTLSDRIARGPMPIAEVVDLVGQACDGVQAAHEAGIVHRDLKPDNLFVIDVEGRPFVKILDFGISKFDPGKTGGLALTQEGAALGTPYYMSPEQIRGEIKLDARTDIYALGVILYECIAGQRPFEAEALTQLAVLIHVGKPPPLSQLRPDLPPGLADLVGKAMATDPALRVQTARDLRAELERYGAISFKGQARLGPTPSLAPSPAASVAARSLATSAAGVSVRAATSTSATSGKGQGLPIAAGFAILALGGAAAAFFLRSGGGAPQDTQQVKSASAAAPTPPTQTHPDETPTPSASAVVAPVPSSSAAKTLATNSPTVAPTLPPPAPLTPPAPAVGPGPGPEKKPRRSDKTGLATDLFK
ncbi:MAG TPA: serine/threonine-protein kinase [Polyangiaceae bacterium]|nr:serine/threonine-protein kinase [Polyangiaceae bacterium]